MSHQRHLRDEAIAIWKAGVAAVDSERLVRQAVQRIGGELSIVGHRFRLSNIGRIAVVGAGKAGAGMAAGFEEAIGPQLLGEKVTGWVNVPADCVRPLQTIHLHAARPAGVNEPTEAGVEGTRRILELVSQLQRDDLCVVLLSGGGSALLPAPVPEITLADKQAVTRHLMHSGATIQELNAVRKHLSLVKGGGLARAARCGTLIALIISDVIGDPLDVIASGPTVPDNGTVAQALAILRSYAPEPTAALSRIITCLETAARRDPRPVPPSATVWNHIIGSNQTALDAAAAEAQRLGYAVRSLGSDNQGEARQVGRDLAELCTAAQHQSESTLPTCLLSGGEPVVHLVPTDQPRKGGRNQEVALAALTKLWDDGLDGIAILSGGTDGEDGPTDAAGAIADDAVRASAHSLGLRPHEFLAVNNSYPFFEQTGGLLKTGPTDTNVMDLRVALIESLV